jgi:SAM domain (Sterile alpha motif)
MQQIAHWLEKLGMSEYTERFAENRIDFSVLRDLTDQDLKDLGVVLGDRRNVAGDCRDGRRTHGSVLRETSDSDADPCQRRNITHLSIDRSHRRAPAFRIPLARAKRKRRGYCTRAGFDPDRTLTVGVPWVSCWRAIAGETLSTLPAKCQRPIPMLGTQSFRESRAYRRK